MTFGSIFVCVSFVAFVNLRWDRLSFVESTLCEQVYNKSWATDGRGGGGGESFFLFEETGSELYKRGRIL